ncbi:hypothetical protein NFI96_033326, partial [Prochilodus magdalenae]
MTFTCGLIVERSPCGTLASVSEKEYMCHVHIRDSGLAAVVIADSEYPQRVCFSLLDKVLDEFSRQVDDQLWPTGTPGSIRFTMLEEYLNKYQNPREADALTRVQADVDETMIIMNRTMESLLNRGEKLDDLVQKSEELGETSKAFYKTVRFGFALFCLYTYNLQSHLPHLSSNLSNPNGLLEPIPAFNGRKAGYTLDRQL